MTQRPPVPPFTRETAVQKVRAAEDARNTRDPARVPAAYTDMSRWRNRDEFFSGREAIAAFLARKRARELDYRLIKELWAFTESRTAVRFVYESHDTDGRWRRCHGNENWLFDADGYMVERHASINDVRIAESERLFRWPQGRARRPSTPDRAGAMRRPDRGSGLGLGRSSREREA
jgi:nuclear transport factor 2 (NTF2) superfamily protein